MSPYFREMVLVNTPKNALKFVCNDCDFKCCKRSDYERHLNTAKHKMVTNGNKIRRIGTHSIYALVEKNLSTDKDYLVTRRIVME